MAEGAETYNELARLRAAPDPDRDARIEAYRDQERRKAARALDRLFELGADDIDVSSGGRARVVAAERFVESLGDYVVSRLQHNRHSDVSPSGRPARCLVCGNDVVMSRDGEPIHADPAHDMSHGAAPDPCAGGRCPDPEAHAEGAHDL